jgi:hypothetical protein
VTLIQNPRDRDFFRYPVYVADGANKIKVGANTITITPGWYFQAFSGDAARPGLWTVISAGCPAGTTLHRCTPVLSTGQVGCGLEIRSTTSVLTDLTITDAIPPALIGWTTTTKTSTSAKSDHNIPGVWRSNSLLDGIASLKSRRSRANAFASHDDPDWVASVWRVFEMVDFRYQAIPAVFALKDRCLLLEYTIGQGVANGDIYAAFESVWLAMIRGREIIVHGDVSLPPEDITGEVIIKGSTSALEDFNQVASREEVAQERYEIAFDAYYVGLVEAAP